MNQFRMLVFFLGVALIGACAKVSKPFLATAPAGEGIQGIALVEWGDHMTSQALRMAVKVVPPHFFRFEVLDPFSGSIARGSCDGEQCVVCDVKQGTSCRQTSARKVLRELFGVKLDPHDLVLAFAGMSSEKKENVQVTLSDYRRVRGKQFPFVISLAFLPTQKFLDIHYQDVERIQ